MLHFPHFWQVTVAVRSLLLRGFDRQCALKVGRCLREIGVEFIEGVLVEKIAKTEKGKLVVSLRGSVDAARQQTLEVDTVLYATGRCADTKELSKFLYLSLNICMRLSVAVSLPLLSLSLCVAFYLSLPLPPVCLFVCLHGVPPCRFCSRIHCLFMSLSLSFPFIVLPAASSVPCLCLFSWSLAPWGTVSRAAPCWYPSSFLFPDLQEVGVHLTAEGKIVCDTGHATTVPSIFAVGTAS